METPETDELGYIPTDLAPAWPIIEHARKLERERDAARIAVKHAYNYMRHHPDCRSASMYGEMGAMLNCDCGLIEALKQTKKMIELTPPTTQELSQELVEVVIPALLNQASHADKQRADEVFDKFKARLDQLVRVH